MGNAATVSSFEAVALARALPTPVFLRVAASLLPEKAERSAWLEPTAPMLAGRAAAAPIAAAASASADVRSAADAARQRASLELKLATETEKTRVAESALRKLEADHKEAMETLATQQRRIRELTEERGKLAAQASENEAKLRLQMNETEQMLLKLERSKSSQRHVGQQATEQTERITALEQEVRQARERVEQALRERDAGFSQAAEQVRAAREQSVEGMLARRWAALRLDSPALFLETHTPTPETFERTGRAAAHLGHELRVVEHEVMSRLKELRATGDVHNRASQLYLRLTEQPGLEDTLRAFLGGTRAEGFLVARARAVQALACAILHGLYAAVVRSRELLADAMNYRTWSVRGGLTLSEDAAIGRYYRETAQREIPDRVGTTLRKLAAEEATTRFEELLR